MASSVAARIDAVVAERAMLRHPFYRAWTAGALSRETLADYAKQYFHHVEVFPCAVSAVHALCPDRAGRRLLAENLAEEEGVGDGREPHAELWLRFADAMGASAQQVRDVARHSETEGLIAAFRACAGRSYAAGLGGLYAYESQLPEVSTSKIEGLARYGVQDAQALSFFRVHQAADVAHAAVCRELLEALAPGEQDEAIEGARAVAEALWTFLDGVARPAGAPL